MTLIGAGSLRRALVGERTRSRLRGPLRLLSRLYGLGVRVRNTAYDRGWKSAQRLPWPVVSVGSVLAGGTGKTPVVALLAGTLGELGRRPLIVMRGYGASDRPPAPLLLKRPRDAASWRDDRIWRRVGDEAVLLASKLPGTPVVAFPDRIQGALQANRLESFDTVILDDGFQHRRLARDLDAVVLDDESRFSHQELLPLGDLREPLDALNRAHCVLLARSSRPGSTGAARETPVEPGRPPWLRLGWRLGAPAALDGTPRGWETDRAGVLAGVARPERFLRDLEASGVHPVWTWLLPDHEPLGGTDVRAIEAAIRRERLEAVFITEKDAVRWREAVGHLGEIRVVPGEAYWLDALDRQAFVRLFKECISRRAPGAPAAGA